MLGVFTGILAALIVLSICIALYNKIKIISLDQDQSPKSQKFFILIRIGLFWGFCWIIFIYGITLLMAFTDLGEYVHKMHDTMTIVGWIVVPLYLFIRAYQLFFGKKTIKDFNKKYYK